MLSEDQTFPRFGVYHVLEMVSNIVSSVYDAVCSE